MNYIDLFLILFVVVFMVLGLLGKLWKKLFIMIFVIISVPVSLLIANGLTNKVADMPASSIPFVKVTEDITTSEWVVEKIKSIDFVGDMYNNIDSVKSFLDNSPKAILNSVLFYVVGILDFFVFMLLGTIIFMIVKLFLSEKEKKKRAFWLFGIPSGVIALVIALFVLQPFYLIAPYSSELVNLYSKSSIKNNKIEAALVTVSEQVETSKLCQISSGFYESGKASWMKYEVNEKEYYLYYELEDSVLTLKTIMPLVEKVKDIASKTQTLDLSNAENVDGMIDLLDDLDEMFVILDDYRTHLNDESHVKGLLSDLLEYYLKEYPTTVNSDSPLYFLRKGNFASVNFEECSLRTDLFPKILQAFLDELVETYNYTYLEDVNVESMTLAEIKGVLKDITSFISLYSKIGDQDIMDMSKEEIIELLSSFEVTETSKQIVSGIIEDLAPDINVDIENIDLEKEGETIGTIIEAVSDPSNINPEEIAGSLAESEIIYAVIESNPQLSVTVSEDDYNTIESTLNEKLSSGSITDEEYNLLIGIFN